MTTLEHDFIEFALKARVLRFGEFKTKAGRLSPYFFNAGLFNTGSLLDRLGAFYAKKILEKRESGELQFDMLSDRPTRAFLSLPLSRSIFPVSVSISPGPSTARKRRITAKAAPLLVPRSWAAC